MRTRRLPATLAVLAALLAPAPAGADSGVARIIGPGGLAIATAAGEAGWTYPADGYLVQVADAVAVDGNLDLRGISLLGGRLQITHAVVGRATVVDGATIDGRPVPPGSNVVVTVPGIGWALVEQRALIPLPGGGSRATGVAVRLHLAVDVAGVPGGSDVLVGYGAGSFTTPALTGSAAEIPPGLVPVYRAAARRYGVPWSVLAAINRVETSFGRNVAISSAGAVGWMQFMPATWAAYGVDANGDGKADPYDPQDAIFSAANLLASNGAATNLRGAVWLYNHSTAYVDLVLRLAQGYGDGAPAKGPTTFTPDPVLGGQTLLFSPVALW